MLLRTAGDTGMTASALTALRVCAALLIAIATSQLPIPNGSVAAAAGREIGSTKTFAEVPVPGEPWGIAVKGDSVYVSTAGTPGGGHPTEDWRIFVYDLASGALRENRTIVIPRMREISFMGLAGMEFHKGLLYVADMNGRVLRVDPRTKKWEVYATIPVLSMADFVITMPFDLTIDDDGNVYIADGGVPGIWRVTPDREIELWYTDVRLFSYPSWVGLFSITTDPRGKDLVFGMCQSRQPDSFASSVIYRLPIDDPATENLSVIHRHGSATSACPRGLAYGRSGKLYVGLGNAGQVQVLRPDGTEERRIAVTAPAGLAFGRRGSLLVGSVTTNTVVDAFTNDGRA